MMTDQQQRVDAVFRDRFGRPSVLAAAAPGRVNLIGEHVDGQLFPQPASDRRSGERYFLNRPSFLLPRASV